MSKEIMFSTVFPKYHYRAGQPTYFVEALYKSLYLAKVIPQELHNTFDSNVYVHGFAKHHTIRAGHRFKEGEKFNAKIWSGIPYRSKKIVIAENIEIKNIFDFDIRVHNLGYSILLDNKFSHVNELDELSKNDALVLDDFLAWFSSLVILKAK